MFAYSIDIKFDSSPRTGAVAGVVHVTAASDTTCRKIVLKWACSEGETLRELRGVELELAKWAEWQAGWSYEYPFDFRPDPSTDCDLHVRPEIHLVGIFEPDNAYDWLRATGQGDEAGGSATKPRDVSDQVAIALSDTASESPSDTGLPLAPRAEIESTGEPAPPEFRITITFDRPDRLFYRGIEITGQVDIVADQDYEVGWFGLHYQWRTHGRGELTQSEPVEVVLAEELSWRQGERHTYPFVFAVDKGPYTYHGHSDNLDWYIWPEIDARPAVTAATSQAETEFFYLPPLTGRLARNPQTAPTDQAETGFNRNYAGSLVALLIFAILYLWLGWDNIEIAMLILFIIGGVLGATYWLVKDSLRRWALRKLGPVGVQIGLSPDRRAIAGTVHFRTRAAIHLHYISAELTVIEETRRKEGTKIVTDTNLLFIESRHEEFFRDLPPGESITSRLEIPFPGTLPNSRNFQRIITGVAVKWCMEISIVTESRIMWRQTFPLKVS